MLLKNIIRQLILVRIVIIAVSNKKKNIGAFLHEINIHDYLKKYYPVIREPMYVP